MLQVQIVRNVSATYNTPIDSLLNMLFWFVNFANAFFASECNFSECQRMSFPIPANQ